MSHPLQLRLSDAQDAALDAAATLTDPFTGLQHTLSRQQVLLSILDAWMTRHATSIPVRTTPSVMDAGAPAVREETIQVIADSAGLPAPAVEELTPETPPMPMPAAPLEPVPDASAVQRLALAVRVRRMREHKTSYAHIAEQFNAELIPTLSGKGQWGTSGIIRLEKYGLQSEG